MTLKVKTMCECETAINNECSEINMPTGFTCCRKNGHKGLHYACISDGKNNAKHKILFWRKDGKYAKKHSV